MNLKIMLIVLPAFVIISGMLIYGLLFVGQDIIMGTVYAIIALVVSFVLIRSGLHTGQSHFKNLSRNTVTAERVVIEFADGVKSVGVFFRSTSQSVSTPEGWRYSEPRPVIVFFHGFMNRKESSEKFNIPLAHYGYVTFTFDQRGHGEAGRGMNNRDRIFEDARTVIDTVCAASDVREGAICCIGTSLGGTTVLTKCYEDPRVAMVVGMSTFHSVAAFGEVKFNPFSIGKFFRWIMIKMRNRDKAPEVSPHYYLKSDPDFNKKRVYLIHGNKDPYFPPDTTFELNKEQTGIPEDQALLLENAGHGLDDQELLVLATFLKWLGEHEKMALKEA